MRSGRKWIQKAGRCSNTCGKRWLVKIFRDNFNVKHVLWQRLRWRFLLPALFLISILPPSAVGRSSDTFRVGFSASFFDNINENDALASIRAWGEIFVNDMEILAAAQPKVYENIPAIKEALNGNQVDFLNIITDEYEEVRELLSGDTVILGVVSESITEEYILIVPKDSSIEHPEDLKGRTLRLLSNTRSSLSSFWLDVLLLRGGMGPASDYLNVIEPVGKVVTAVLPVFFGKVDACVATRSAFDTMVELNPQIGQKLKIIAVSPPLVPNVFCFSKHIDTDFREKIVDAIKQWHLTPSGKQVLTIFQTDRVEEHSMSILETTLDLIAERERLLDSDATVRPGDLSAGVADEVKPAVKQ